MFNQLHILLVEDDEIDQRAFQRMMSKEQLPYDCTIASTVEEAFYHLRESVFDVVLLDYRLGDGTGLDVLEHHQDVPMIFITGMGSEEIAVQAMQAGAIDYIVKDSDGQYLKSLPLRIETALKHAANKKMAQLLQAQQVQMEMLRDFIQNISHDLRTPLAGLALSASLIQQQADVALQTISLGASQPSIEKIKYQCDSIQQFTSRLHNAIERMTRMVELDRLQALPLHPENLSRLLASIHQRYQTVAEENILQFDLVLPAQDLIINAAHDELHELVVHLLENAFHFTPSGGSVTISAVQQDDKVHLAIADTGKGIDKNQFSLIFEPLYRVDKSRNSDHGGTGMGLPLAKRITELHHAHIEVKSKVGSGSTFRVIFPALS